MYRTAKALKFIVVAPFILLMLVAINWFTTPGEWWVQWAALGIGIAWVVNVLRVARVLLLGGGAAAVVAWFHRRAE